MTESNTTPATRKPSSEPLIPPRKQEYVYHWDRILGAILLSLVLLGLTAYGIHAWFVSSPEVGSDMAEALPEEEVTTLALQPDLKEDPIPQSAAKDPSSVAQGERGIEPAQVAEDTGSSPGTQETLKPLLEEAVIKEDDISQQYAVDKPLETDPSTPASIQPHVAGLETTEEASAEPVEQLESESVTVVQPAEDLPVMASQKELAPPQVNEAEVIPLDPEAETSDTADTTMTAGTPTSPFQLKELKILEPKVKRFLLTRAVARKEPLGELNDISFNAYGSAVVWSYSEVVDMNGSQLSYAWLHEGNRVARVSVDIRANRWRSYSNKIINQTMRGAWRVELLDGKGRLLASADFSLESD